MGNNKKTIGLSIALILLVLIFALASCSPVKRHARLVKKYPFVHHTDTVVLKDTFEIIVPTVQKDTVFQIDSFLVSLKDTIVVVKDNLVVKLTQVHDSIYVDAKCDTVYVDKIIERKIPVKYYETVDDFSFRNYGKCIFLIFVILLMLILLLKIIQFLRP